MEHVVAADAVESRRTVSCRRRLLRTSLTWPLLLSTLTQLLRGRATKRCHYSYVEKSATLMQLLRGGATLFTYAALTGSTSLGTASFAWEQPEKIQRNTLVEKNTVQYCSHTLDNYTQFVPPAKKAIHSFDLLSFLLSQYYTFCANLTNLWRFLISDFYSYTCIA